MSQCLYINTFKLYRNKNNYKFVTNEQFGRNPALEEEIINFV